MIGSIIGGAMKIGGSIFGGISASKAMKKVKGNIEEQRRRNQDWYDRRFNEDATQRADAQRILNITQENIRKRNQQAAATQAVMGGTEESVAAAKAANNEALAEAASQIAVNGERRKDAIERQYLETDNQLQNQLNNLEINKASAISQAVKGVGDASAGFMGETDEAFKVNQKPPQTEEG